MGMVWERRKGAKMGEGEGEQGRGAGRVAKGL